MAEQNLVEKYTEILRLREVEDLADVISTYVTHTDRKKLIKKAERLLSNNTFKHRTVRDVLIRSAELHGEHLGSVVKNVTLTFEDHADDGKVEEPLELFVKEVPKNESHAGFVTELKLFEREAQVYNELIPAMQKFYTKNAGKADPMDFFVKCYYADDKEIILHNIKNLGYYLNSKFELQDYEHATLMLQNFAQFHAVGYAMIKDMGGREAALEKYPCLNEVMLSLTNMKTMSMLESIKRSTGGLLKTIPGGEDTLKRLAKYENNFVMRLVDLASPNSKHVFNVVCHGDAWNNNMMFYKDPATNQVAKHMFVDFQMTRCGSPSMDLNYILFTSVKPEVRRQHLRQMLVEYFRKLSTAVELMTKTPFPFTFEQFLEDFKAKSLFGFWMHICFNNFILDLLASIDPTQMKGDFIEFLEKSIQKWITENPGKATESAKEITEFLDEFEEFMENA